MAMTSAAPLGKRGPMATALSSPVGLLGKNLGPQAHVDDALLGTREDQPATWRGSVSANNYVDLSTHDKLMSKPAAVRLRLLENVSKAEPVPTPTAAKTNEPLEDDLTFIRRTRSQFDRTTSMPVRHVSRGPAPAPGPFFEPVKANYHPSVETGSNEVLPFASSKPQPSGMTLHKTIGRDGFQRFASVPAHTYAASHRGIHEDLDVLGAKPEQDDSAAPMKDMDSVLARWAEEDEEGGFGSDDSSSSSDSDEGLTTDAPTTAPYAHPVPSHPHPKMGKPVPGPGGATPWARRTFRPAQSAPVGALEFGRVNVNHEDLDADAPWRKVDFNKYFDADNVNF